MMNATKLTKYGTAYNTPIGLEEDVYYNLLYEFVDLAKAKGLTVRQAQKLFTDCADMVLDTQINSAQNKSDDNKSDIGMLVSELEQITQSLNYLPDRLSVRFK